jgi:hypothetical protein
MLHDHPEDGPGHVFGRLSVHNLDFEPDVLVSTTPGPGQGVPGHRLSGMFAAEI